METTLSGVANGNDRLLKNTLNPYQTTEKKSALTTQDSLSIGIMTPKKTQAILNRELADKLEQRFKDEGIELKGLKAEDFTPQKVSDRIMSFVSGRILSEQDTKKQQQLMQQARDGVEQGFAQARDILDSLSVLNGQVKDNVNKTYDLIQQGLDKLNQQITGQQDNDTDNNTSESTTAESTTAVEQASIASSFSRTENTRLEILTSEGDKVIVELFKNQHAQSSRSASSSADGNSLHVSRSLSASTGLSYQVDGNLNKKEQQAIDGLLNNVAKVSAQFFSGDVQDAFNYAQKMNFDNKELTKFSLNMSYQETRQAAISTYSSYQPDNSTIAQDNGNPVLQNATDFISRLDELLQNPFAQEKLAAPEKSVSELLKGMNNLLYSDELQQLQQDSASLLDSLVEQIKQYRGGVNSLDNVVSDSQKNAA